MMLVAQSTYSTTTDSEDSPLAVLFVGNSFSYYNNSLHNHFKALAIAASASDAELPEVRLMAISAGRLEEHTGLTAMLKSTQWDIVVLQGFSTGPINDATSAGFRAAATEHAASIRKYDARPVMFMTWAYEGQPQMTASLDDAYSDIGRSLDAQVVPVGLAFEAVTLDRPDIVLRIRDGKHPTLAGTYLGACMFYAALYGASPVGLDYTAGLDTDVVAYLQHVAWVTSLEFEQREAK